MLVAESKIPRLRQIMDEGSLVHTESFGGRVILVIYKGRLSEYVAEILPFEVSWSVNADASDSKAIEIGRKLSKDYFQNLVDSIK